MVAKKVALPRRCCAKCKHRCDRLIDAYWCTLKFGFFRMEDVCSRFITGKAHRDRGKRPAGMKPNEVWRD